jgi:hypothetical protein
MRGDILKSVQVGIAILVIIQFIAQMESLKRLYGGCNAVVGVTIR